VKVKKNWKTFFSFFRKIFLPLLALKHFYWFSPTLKSQQETENPVFFSSLLGFNIG
jgi:hypothetical protein